MDGDLTEFIANLSRKRDEIDEQLTAAFELSSAANPAPEPDMPTAYPGARWAPEAHTGEIMRVGRPTARNRRLPGGARRVLITLALILIILAGALVRLANEGSVSWPLGVQRVQSEVVQACKNPDVAAEPAQVNVACASSTRRILWVFALMTSGGNADFADAKTGRVGLEPIVPQQGAQVAWALNLHHPYSPLNPLDSIQVAARAINNIIGGATTTLANGKPVAQAGLEGIASNCARYTGSAKLSARNGFPPLCARPVSPGAGQAALVADVYQKWVPGASPAAAHEAAVLFENASNPGNPQVQSYLKHLKG